VSLTELASIAKLIEVLGGWPIGLLIVLTLIGPWIVLIWIVRGLAAADKKATENAAAADKAATERAREHDLKSQENLAKLKEITEAGWQAYKDNVDLVKETQAVAKQAVNLASELAEIVHLNTQAMTTLIDSVKNNMFCPQVRKATGKD
jgi:hypothetical protein